MRLVFRLLLLACLVAFALASAASAPGSEPLTDANVSLGSLQVNAKGEALVTYRRSDGRIRRVLVWGALNARPPSAEVPQVRFRWDYAGGWGKYRNGKYWTRFKNRCGAYDGPPLPMLVAACKAPNGTYWTIQAWQRRLPLLGFDPWLPEHTNVELHVAHWSGALPLLEAHSKFTYDGRWQGVFGRYSYLGSPVYGFGATPKGVPKDNYGRNLYIDTLNSAYGPGWKRESGILTHKGTGTFCHSFVPQRPFAGYPSQDLRPAAPGERYRFTAGGPGVTPVMQVEVPGLTDADRGRDDEFNAVFDRVMVGDRLCAGER
ncbi:MAG: hypothetical protein WD015_02150 [Gaiellaceae bacterium]